MINFVRGFVVEGKVNLTKQIEPIKILSKRFILNLPFFFRREGVKPYLYLITGGVYFYSFLGYVWFIPYELHNVV